MKKINRTIFLVTVIFVFFFLLGGKRLFNPGAQVKDEYRYISLFAEVASLVKQNYVEEVKAEDKFPGAFSAMLSTLDDFSAYLDEEKTHLYRAYLDHELCGPGIYGARRYNYFVITDVLPGSPAHKAGLKPGHLIKAVNGKSLYARSLWEMLFSIHTLEPAPLDIAIFSEDRQSTRRFKVKTLRCEPGPVIKRVKKNILLVNLDRLDPTSAQALADRLTEASTKQKSLKLIIDLRRYCGGDISSFKRIAGLLFKKTPRLTLKTKNSEEHFQPALPTAPDYRAAVIINRSTRMYGELLAHFFEKEAREKPRRVLLVGNSTPGFISHLEPVDLGDGSSILLTGGQFLLNGGPTASLGVKPDVAVSDKKPNAFMKECFSFLSESTPVRKKNSPVKKSQKTGSKKKLNSPEPSNPPESGMDKKSAHNG